MKKILVSLMTICLVAGLVGGGLFADFSDIETSRDNYFETGSMDLKVTYLGAEYEDPNVPVIVDTMDALPGCEKPFEFDLHNYGQGDQVIPTAYLHIKNLECYGILKTEPELAAETGATPIGEKADGTPVYATPPLGEFGEGCELAAHVHVKIEISTDSGITWTTVIDCVKLDTIVCQQIELGLLAPCDIIHVRITLMLQDIAEEDLGYNLFDEGIPAEEKWNDWPTNALQKDGMSFDMAFELLQN